MSTEKVVRYTAEEITEHAEYLEKCLFHCSLSKDMGQAILMMRQAATDAARLQSLE